jgi:hypothetical protein
MDCGETISYQALLNKVLVRYSGGCYGIKTFGKTLDPLASPPVECAGKTLLELLWLTYDESKSAISIVEDGAFDPYFTCDNTGVGIETVLRDLVAVATDGSLAIRVNLIAFSGDGTCMDCANNATPIQTLVRSAILLTPAGKPSISASLRDPGIDFDCDTVQVPDFATAVAGLVGLAGEGINIVNT